MGTIRDGEAILGEVFEHTNYGTCSTLASEQIKEVYCPIFRYYIGARISIKFTNGNTAGTCVGTDSNVIDPLTAPKISLNGQTHTIYVGGEPAGEGFINSGDVHDFVFDGENWADITADVIYKGGDDTNGKYEKHRNGVIEQWLNVTATVDGVITVTLQISFTNNEYVVMKQYARKENTRSATSALTFLYEVWNITNNSFNVWGVQNSQPRISFYTKGE